MIKALGPIWFLYKLYFGIVFYLSLIILYPFFWITTRKEKWYPACFKLKLLWGQILQISLLIFIRRQCKAPLPDGPFIVACNHSSYLDIVFMYRVIFKKFIFLGKAELLKWPLFSLFFRTMDIAVDRSNHVKAAKSLVRAKQYLDDGYAIAIFPEGTIPATAPVMKRFKDGAFKLAIEKQVPIVPVSFLNNWSLFAEPTELFSRAHPGLSRVVIHEPISTEGMTLEDLVTLRDRTFEVIREPIAAHNKDQYDNN